MQIASGDYLLVDRPDHGPMGVIAVFPERNGLIYAVNEFGNVTNVKVEKVLDVWPNCPVAAGKKAFDRWIRLKAGIKICPKKETHNEGDRHSCMGQDD